MIFAAAGLVLDRVARDPLVLARGSDALTRAIRPDGQDLSRVVFASALIFAVVATRRVWSWAVACTVGWCALLLGLHAVVIDAKDDEVRETWGPLSVRAFRLRREGDPRPLFVQDGRWSLRSIDDSGRTGSIFLGIEPWRIDPRRVVCDELLAGATRCSGRVGGPPP